MSFLCYKNVVFYQGNVYVNEDIQGVYIHNRLQNLWKPKSISTLPIDASQISELHSGCVLLEGFHANMGHNLWDAMYPTWYGIYKHLPEYIHDNFQWITTFPVDQGWHLEILETFSGNPIYDLNSFSTKQAVRVPWFIAGGYGIGINNVTLENCAVISDIETNDDPIELFVNRMYQRYHIIRNPKVPENYTIGWVRNKRLQNDIPETFHRIETATHKNCEHIYWERISFRDQLLLLNQLGILIVGVGTARANSPFMPHGAIEIQTGDFATWNHPSLIQYFDCHIGTISQYIRVMNIPYYTQNECMHHKCSSLIFDMVLNATAMITAEIPSKINRIENIPTEVREKLTHIHSVAPFMFNIWRDSFSNDVSHLIRNYHRYHLNNR